MIIVEGMDNTGKSTLISGLTRELRLDLLKSPGPKDDQPLPWVIRSLKEKSKHIVYDRYFLISERVYGPVLRDGDVLGDYTFVLLSFLLRKCPLIIYCRPEVGMIEKWGDRQQMDGVKRHFSTLINRYDWLMDVIEGLACNSTTVYRYDYSQPNAYENVKSVVKTYLKELK